ncbi:MAG: phosphoglycerate kinase, partial [Actinomycetia bacterium]|nr:phosphoglycerate kinase [Actinomycetes bacterium]
MPSLDDLQVAGHVVIVRVDFNVPLADDGAGGRVITDTGRIHAALPTIDYLREHRARILLLAHLGRPKGVVTPEASLEPVAQELSRVLSIDVPLAADLAQARDELNRASDGGVVVLENIRFDARETSKDPAERAALARELADLGDFFVSDGFGVVHREQASVTELAAFLP